MKRLIIFLALVILTTGCATSSGPLGQGEQLYYPMCYSPLQQARRLDSRARDVAEGLGRGTLLGTLAGAVGGAVSALFTGNALDIVSGAAIGAAGGAVAGGISGGMQNNEAEKTALVAEWSQETGIPLEAMGFTGAAAEASIHCYNQRLAQLDAEIKDGILTQAAAEPRRVEIELGRQEAYQLLQSTANH